VSQPTFETTRITAAFIILFETFLAGQLLRERPQLEPIIDALRRTISLSRKEAQYLLQTGTTDVTAPAFVLAYEGIGSYRAEHDFTFAADDIILLQMVRSRVRMTLKRAVAVLMAEQAATNRQV
jgi:hypothetical protein